MINLGSGAATTALPGWSAYSTAKAALEHLTRILAAEEPAITALTVRPGIVDTAMQAEIRAKGRGGMAPADYERLSGLHQQGRLTPARGSGPGHRPPGAFRPARVERADRALGRGQGQGIINRIEKPL